jgi:CRP/FNR family cyclic AMP-dependent transcriptional regulator
MDQATYLHQVLPFLTGIEKSRREQIETYFRTAPVWLLDSIKILNLGKNEIFVREDEPVDTVYIIGKGKIKGVDLRMFGITYDFMTFDGIYAMGGMEVVMDLDKYRTTLQTVEPCTLISIPKSKFEKWLKTDIKALKQEAKKISEYLLVEARQGRTFLFLYGKDRLCLIFTQRYEDAAKDGIYEVRSTRQQLALESGLSVKTVNRAVKTMEEDEWISRKGNKILINKKQYEQMKKVVSELIES